MGKENPVYEHHKLYKKVVSNSYRHIYNLTYSCILYSVYCLLIFMGPSLRSHLNRRKIQKLYHSRKYYNPENLPGEIITPTEASETEVNLIDYSENSYTSRKNITVDECSSYLESESVSWVDVQGLRNRQALEQIGRVFGLHRLVLEDVINMLERPKIEDYEEQIVIIARMVVLPKENEKFHHEQVSFVLGKSYLLTVQEEKSYDCFGPVRMRIEKNRGIIRRQGVDYLTYALLDSIIDGFFPILENYGERIEQLEEEVITNPTPKTLQKIYEIRRDLLLLRRAIWPQRDAINILIRDGSSLISHDVRLGLRDCYDHTVQVIDMVEIYRELTSGLMDVYLSVMGNKMNEIMKTLTVISSIFIPLTFIAGIYGMNFNTEKSPYNMPELNWYWGYPVCLAIMVAIAIGLLFFFRQRGWLKNTSVSAIKTHTKKPNQSGYGK